MLGTPAADGGRRGQPHAALLGELEGVGQQVLEHLLQPLGVGGHAARQMLVDLDLEGQMPVVGFVAERPRDRVDQVRYEHLLGVHRNGAGLDLRQVENVADQVQEIGAGAVDGARELHLLGREVAVRVVAELLAENEDRVQRRAQLVRHVGEEFRLVLGGERELGGLFFQRAAGLLDFLVLALDFDVLLGELLRLLFELLVGLLQLPLLGLQFAGELLRLRQQAFGLHRRFDGVEHDADRVGQLLEEHRLQGGELRHRGKLDHRLDLVFEQHRQHDDVARHDLEQRRADRHRVGRQFGDQQAALVGRALADQAFADPDPLRMTGGAVVGIGREEPHGLQFLVLHLIDDAKLGVDQRRQFGEQQPSDRGQIALALQHVGEFGEVGLQPVLLGVAVGGEPQVVDHRVDVVFELGDFAAGIDLNRSRQVALGHGGRHLGDGADLRGQVGGQQVDVAGEILPGAGGAGHVGLAAEAAFDADLARHRRHLIGEDRQRVGHVVDGFGERRDLALGLHGEVLLEVAVGDRGHHLDDAAHLFGQVRRHHVHGVGQVLPGAGDAGHLGLAAELAFGADLARDAGDFRGEAVELVHHGVDGVLQLEDFALHVHGDLARQVAARHGGGHFGDVADLGGEVGRQQVDVVGQDPSRCRQRRAPRPGRRGGRRFPPRARRASLRRRTSEAARSWC